MGLASITCLFGVLWIGFYYIFKGKLPNLIVYLFGFGRNFPISVYNAD